MIVRFRSSMEHEDLLKKVKKMKEFTQDLEECLMDAIEDSSEYRGGRSYRRYEDDEMMERGGRYRNTGDYRMR